MHDKTMQTYNPKGKDSIALILLGPKNYQAEFGGPLLPDYGARVLGETFQKALRSRLHKVDSRYTCQFCGGSGTYFLLGDKDEKAFIEEITQFGLIEMNKGIREVLLKVGVPESDASIKYSKNANKKRKVLTPFLNTFLKDTGSLKQKINLHTEKMKQLGTTSSTSLTEGAKVTKAFVKKWKLGTKGRPFRPCPACLGNGYYDVGHEAYFGKQADVFKQLYLKYILNNSNPDKWQATLTRKEVWDVFWRLKVKPEFATQQDFDTLKNANIDVEELTINRYIAFSQANASAKLSLYAKFYAIYKGQESSTLDENASFDNIANFYRLLSSNARVKTGRLRDYLSLEASNVEEERDNWIGVSNSFISNFVIIQGPTAHSRPVRSKSNVNNMYVYASQFVPLKLREPGYGASKAELPWSKTTTIEELAIQADLETMQIKYFPQRVT